MSPVERRKQALLYTLSNHRDFVTADELSGVLDISTKSIYRLIKQINDESRDGVLISSEKGRGFKLEYRQSHTPVSASEKDVPEGILIATGSEVSLAVQAQKTLKEQGQDVRVVSLPSFDLFEQQTAAYKEGVLPQAVGKRVAVEAGATFGWERYVGFGGKVIGIDYFGTSSPGDRILKEFGFTVENVINTF